MKKRPDSFLDKDNIDHESEIFDYIRELHHYLWEFTRLFAPGVGGYLNEHIDEALEIGKKVVKKIVQKACPHKKTIALNEEGNAGIYCSDCGEKLSDEC